MARLKIINSSHTFPGTVTVLQKDVRQDCTPSKIKVKIEGDFTDLPVTFKLLDSPSGSRMEIDYDNSLDSTTVGKFRRASDNSVFTVYSPLEGSNHTNYTEDLLLTVKGSTTFTVYLEGTNGYRIPGSGPYGGNLTVLNCQSHTRQDIEVFITADCVFSSPKLDEDISLNHRKTMYYTRPEGPDNP